MASYKDDRNNTWIYTDGSPDFPTWVAADAARTNAWQAACDEFNLYKQTNDGREPENSTAGTIFQQWMADVGANREDLINR